MAEDGQSKDHFSGSTKGNGTGEPKDPLKQRKPFTRLALELTPEELNQSGAQKMILDALSRLEEDNAVLVGFRDMYHEADKNVATLTERLRGKRFGEAVFGVCMAVGGALLSYGYKDEEGGLLSVMGLVLVSVAIIALWKFR